MWVDLQMKVERKKYTVNKYEWNQIETLTVQNRTVEIKIEGIEVGN